MQQSRLAGLFGALLLAACAFAGSAVQAAQPAIRVVAAESVYGKVVTAIGGTHVQVTSLLEDPYVNPHEFEGTPRLMRQLEEADVIIFNGLGYDDWMHQLLQGLPAIDGEVISAGEAASALVAADRNPHLFHSPDAMALIATQIAETLSRLDPAHADDYADGLRRFHARLEMIQARARPRAAAHADLTVTATEPVYNYMLDLLDYNIVDRSLQRATMNGSQPGARQVRELIRGLQDNNVQLLLYNRQVHGQLARMLTAKARHAGIPVVAVSELPPPDQSYAQWQLEQLQAVQQALDAQQ